MEDCYVINSIYDNGGLSFDRYTICFNDGSFLGLSFNPDSPMGYSQHGECQPGNHLGKKINFESLPVDIQSHIIRRNV